MTGPFPFGEEMAVVSLEVVSSSGVATCTPDGLDAVAWRDRGGALRTARADRRLLGEDLWRAGRVRAGAQYPNRRNRHGWYLWSGTGEYVWHESALELAALVQLDFSGDVQRVAAQPFRLLFRTGSPVAFHDPDFFAVHAGGDQVVYDVKPAARIDQKARTQFEQTGRLCALVGWRHVVLTGPSREQAANLGFLRAARLPRCHPPVGMAARLLQVFAGGRPIGQGATAAGRGRPGLVMPYIRHLIWHRVLLVDLDRVLDVGSIATTAEPPAGNREGGAWCCG